MSEPANPKNPYVKQKALILKLWRRDPTRLFGVERWFLLGLATSLSLLPAMFVRLVGGWFGYFGRKLAVEFWVFAKPAALFAILLCGLPDHRWAAVAALVSLLDLYAYLLGLVFLNRYYTAPASYGRSVLLLGANLLEAIFAFAVLYLHFGALGRGTEVVHSWSDAVYFSVITAATVGYGDIIPITNRGRLLVVVQVLSAFLFVAIVLSTFVSNLASVRDQRANKRMEPSRQNERT